MAKIGTGRRIHAASDKIATATRTSGARIGLSAPHSRVLPMISLPCKIGVRYFVAVRDCLPWLAACSE